MHLRRLEIAGFKSFGSRVKLDFQSGISAIVGPNGSGKSNVAEAIRWVLGSQNIRDLRARKTEELIYAGADGGKAKASMAEVILTLEGKPEQTELGVSELVISRRLYRSGESEYRLGGRLVRVKDLQRILAQAGFGTASYTVIGQGMVDSLIIASPSERKLLFEEASGIRAFELERADTIRKLDRARTQAAQLREQAQSLAPERTQLAEQVKRLERRRDIEQMLIDARTSWLTTELASIAQRKDAQAKLRKKDTEQITTLQKQIKTIERELETLDKASRQSDHRQQTIIARLSEIDAERDALSLKIASQEAELRLQEEQVVQGDKPTSLKREQATERAKLQKFQQYLSELTQQNNDFDAKIAVHNATIAELNAKLTTLRQKLVKNQRNEHLTQALGLARIVYARFNHGKEQNSDQLRVALHKLIRMIKLASEADMSQLPGEIGKAQQRITREIAKREDIVEEQTTLIIKMRSLELDIHASEKLITELTSRITKAEALAKPVGKLKEIKRSLAQSLKLRAGLDTEATNLRTELTKLRPQQQTDKQLELTRHNETVKAQLTQHEHEIQRSREEEQALLHEEQRLQAQAKTWHIKLPASSASQPKTFTAQDISRLEAELEIIGDIDVTLTHAHDELSERIEHIESQAHDLETASDDLTRVLTELERRIRQTFDTNFARLNTSFGKHFKELFGGGAAELQLRPDENGSFGIEIIARPPSKRVEHLASLSGGEKALTAIALLAAILTVNPSPFVVLDEVDAPLDDANTLAFTHILRTLAKHSQLLVITHNHETMLQADELFGVTANARMSSRVIAVDLRTAEALTTT